MNRDSAFHRLALVVLVALSTVLTATAKPLVAQESSPTPAPTPTVGPAIDLRVNEVRVTKRADPTQLLPGQEALVTLSLRGDLEGCLGAPGAPLDVMLIIDNSLSARAWGRLDRAKAIAQSFMDQLSHPVYFQWDQSPLRSRVGLVTSNFTDQGPQTDLVELSEDFSTARAQVDTISADNDTGLDSGMLVALDELKSKRRPEAKQLVFLVIHDNVPFTDDASSAAEEIRKAGVAIYVVGVGRQEDLAGEETEAELLTWTANTGQYLFEPEPSDLYLLFVDASEGTQDVAALDCRISDEFLPPGLVELVPGSTNAQRRDVSFEERDGRPTWQIPFILKDETVTLSYRVRAPLDGIGGRVELATSHGWLSCNGAYHSWTRSPDASAFIDVLLPTPTLIPTDTPIPSPTPTATETLPPTAAAPATQAPAPTAELLATETIPIPTATDDQSGFPVISPVARRFLPFLSIPWREILFILLLLLLLWLLWQLLRRLLRQRRIAPAKQVVIQVAPPIRRQAPPTVREPEPTAEPLGATVAGAEGDDAALLQELLQEKRWRGQILTTESGLREPWPIQVQTASAAAGIEALKLKNRGGTFHWRKSDRTGLQIPVAILEKALAHMASPRCPVIVVGHQQPTENLELVVEISSNELKRQTEIAVRAVYQEPEGGQEPSPLQFHLDIRAVENPIGPLVSVPILEQNL